MSNLTRFRTQILIKEAFMDLLKEKPFSSITINHICDMAMIHRSTFYRYYDDKYELFLDTTNSIAIDLFKQTMQGFDMERTIFEEVIEYVDENREQVLNITIKNNSYELYDKLIQLGSEILLENSGKNNDLLSQQIRNSKYPKVLCDFYISGFIEIVKKWISDEYPYSKEELLHIVKSIQINEPF